jgi:hypothetical protein
VTDVRFRAAAGAYLLYGAVYYVGGLYLVSQGVGVMGGSSGGGRGGGLLFWAITGLVPFLGIPWLLHSRRPGFEGWVLSRRDFARLVSGLLAFRAYKVGQVAFRPDAASVAAPWGGAVTFQIGAAIFLVVTLLALVMVARAAWAREAGA